MKEKDYRKRVLWHKFKIINEEEEQEKRIFKKILGNIFLFETSNETSKERLEKTYDENLIQELEKSIKLRRKMLKKLYFTQAILIQLMASTKLLKDKRLTEEEKKYYNQKRDNLRKILKEDRWYKIELMLEEMRDRFGMKKI